MHFGVPDHASSLAREKHFVQWLTEITPRCERLILLGDIFDFWFEYKYVQPRGYVRLLGKLAEMSDMGIPIEIFSGNHDLWFRDFFPKEIGAEVHHKPVIRTFFGKTYYLAHGDGLGPGDHGYKLMKRVFTSPMNQWIFARLHPNFATGLANFFSRKSRLANRDKDSEFFGEKEFLIIHAREMLAKQPELDHFVFGHRHHLKTIPLTEGKSVFYLGDWIQYFSYLEIGEQGAELKQFQPVKKQNKSLAGDH